MGGTESNIWKFGKPKYRCEHYNALIWYEDRPRPKLATKRPAFGSFCKKRKTKQHPPKPPPPPYYLDNLLNGEG